ncbi:MAG: biotin transporter BioY, partial [Armatimonadota bacterium]
FAAFAVGWLLERGWSRRMDLTLAALLIGNAAIYAFGLPWLALFVGWNQVLQMGLLPFLPGDLIKSLIAASIVKALCQAKQ